MSRKDFCNTRLKDTFKGVREEVLNDISETVDYIRRTSKNTGDMNTRMKKFYADFLEDAKIEVKNRKKNALVIDEESQYILREFKDRPDKGLESLLVGTEGAAFGSGRSIYAYSDVISDEMFSILNYELNSKRFLEIAKSGDLDRDLFRVMDARRRGQKLPAEIDPRAKELADIYAKVFNRLQDHVEMAGSKRGRYEGYLGRRSYDGVKVREMTMPKWREFMKQRLDLDKTFGPQFDDPKFIDAELERIWEDIVRGEFDKSRVQSEGPDITAVYKQGSRDKRKSKSRNFFFKDGDGEFEVFKEFGNEVLLEDVMSSIGRDSRYAAAMTRLGPDYERNWEAIKSIVSQNASIDGAKKLNTKIKSLDGLFDVAVNGFRVGHGKLAKVATAVKALNRTAILGGVTPISSLTDFASHVANLQSMTGKSYMGSLMTSLNGYTKNLTGKSKQQVFKKLQTYVNNGLGEYHSRFSPDDIALGWTSRMQDTFFRLSGQTYQSSHWQMANEFQFSEFLGDFAKKDFNSLKPETQRFLGKYGIDEPTLKQLRGAIDEDGMIHADSIDNMTGISAKEKRDLKLKTVSYLRENAKRISHPGPGIKERYAVRMGIDEDSVAGVLLSMITDLSSFPLSILRANKNIVKTATGTDGQQSIFKALSTPAGAKTAAGLFASLTTAGAMSVALRDMANNKKPQIDTKEFWIRAIGAGGAAGLYSDYLLAPYHEHYRSLEGNIAGPVIGGPLASVTENMASIIYNGEVKPQKLINDLWDTIPGNNLFYSKAVLDYYILENLQEAASPGFKMRKRRMERNRGQEPLF